MAYSISRKALTLAIAITLPQAILFYAFAPATAVRWVSLSAALAGIGAAWLFSWSLARRIKSLTAFVDGLLDLTTRRPKLTASDDELGQLAHSLSGMAPR